MPKYSEVSLLNAIDAVKSGSSVNKAANTYGIPESSLRYKIRTDSTTIEKRGRQRHLSPGEEQDLVDWIIECANRGNFLYRYDYR